MGLSVASSIPEITQIVRRMRAFIFIYISILLGIRARFPAWPLSHHIDTYEVPYTLIWIIFGTWILFDLIWPRIWFRIYVLNEIRLSFRARSNFHMMSVYDKVYLSVFVNMKYEPLFVPIDNFHIERLIRYGILVHTDRYHAVKELNNVAVSSVMFNKFLIETEIKDIREVTNMSGFYDEPLKNEYQVFESVMYELNGLLKSVQRSAPIVRDRRRFMR